MYPRSILPPYAHLARLFSGACRKSDSHRWRKLLGGQPWKSIFNALFLTANFFLTASFMAPCIAQEIRIPKESGEYKLADRLIEELIKRGNKYTIRYPYGDIESIPLSTILHDVDSKEIDIFWTMSNPEYEKQYRAIYFPIYRGMLGMRVSIIKKEKQQHFNKINSLEDLKKLTAGQGKFWADTQILLANGLPVVKELKYTNLFRMLEAERFDYFPRGILEPWLEVQREAELDLAVDESLLLWYKSPFYFFVHKDNSELANHLEEQFESMLADGSYLDMFYQDREVKSALSQANILNRHIIKLDNPFLTKKTPLERDILWFNPYTEGGQKSTTVTIQSNTIGAIQ